MKSQTKLPKSLWFVGLFVLSTSGAMAQTEEETVAVLSGILTNFLNKKVYPDGICFYEEAEMAGERFCTTYSMLTMPSGWDDRASSVTVSSAYSVVIYQDPNFSGSSVTYENNNSLSGLNNAVSSFEVYITDEDGDGIGFDQDTCPSTPEGESVNTSGCSTTQLDTDLDGVADAYDLCSSTGTATQVDVHGCGELDDSDNDGVLNKDDAYPLQHNSMCIP